MNQPEQYAYRVAALLAPGATVIGLATLYASDGGSGITGPEAVMAVVATITALAAKVGVDHLPGGPGRYVARRAAQRPPTGV